MKKVKIFTQNYDPSSDEIIDWIRYYDSKIQIDRINCKHDLNKHYIKDEKCVLFFKKYRHLLSESISKGNESKSIENKDELIDFLQKSSEEDIKIVLEYLMCSEENIVIGNKEPYKENKLIQLEKAKKVGLEIPLTIVTNSKKELSDFFQLLNSQIITKPLFNAIFFDFQNDLYASYTKRISENFLENLPTNFSLSLFQEEIDKEFEIRTFYFYGDCYSIAIFSQQNEQTSVDYRIYSNDKPNRKVPYQLSEEMKSKIDSFMKHMNLEMGSIDFIKSKDGKIYFLEVNPEGQFGVVSKSGNYNLEELIAIKILNECN